MTTPTGATLTYSIPGTRMTTITSSQAPKVMYQADTRDINKPGSSPYLAGGPELIKASPLQMVEQQIQRVDDFRSQHLTSN